MQKLITEFENHFEEAPKVYAAAPGRLEVLGNHTDYNSGFVLSCAVDQKIKFAVSPSPDKICRFKNLTFDDYAEFSLDNIATPAKKSWTHYLQGIYSELNKRNIFPGAIHAVVDSELPLGAGMSSSAALEMGFCLALEELFKIGFDATTWAKIGQATENNYLGLRCGLLDQFSSVYGKKHHLLLLDFRSNKLLKSIELSDSYCFLIANSMQKHNLVDSAYNKRRRQCESAARKLYHSNANIAALRDASMEELENSKSELTHLEYLRAKHIIGENERVLQAVDFLERHQIDAFGKLLLKSHESSKHYFDNSTPRLDYLIELAQVIPGCCGARLSGGGFGGVSIHLVHKDQLDSYKKRLKTAFSLKYKEAPDLITCEIGGGAVAKTLN